MASVKAAKGPVLVGCCCNKIPYTGWLVSKISLFLVALEAGMPKVRMPVNLVSGEEPLPADGRLLAVSSRGRERASSRASYKGRNPVLDSS